ncbi:MAG TPA: UDP-2,3-diacylglucosamine diphosphatase [Candidatus Coprenecus stercoravium]|uniref:UDP-2,3-diacylglucosamine diphosphatase n=1 Tax=Candidatus Coprenecus stercoravium TaxID=2840735 RepID=A0A9D2KAW8_9BACT|nr:UDP-2,3-diacylglucosamine diphosphatase [Candidatus Coprenecus stercoravium]
MAKTYFISDVHLGAAFCDRDALESRFVALLDAMREEKAGAVYLLGDIFDFWYEYRYVIPRGCTRTLGALARLCDSGTRVFFMRGNHDVWVYDYFEKEIGMKVLEQPYVTEIDGRLFCLGHGDGLGRTDTVFRIIRWAFHNRFLQVLFSALHPRWAFGLGYAWAGHSRKMKNNPQNTGKYVFRGDKEPLYHYAEAFGRDYAENHGGRRVDYYIFGHYHTPGSIDIPSGGRMFILGCWVDGGEYAVFEDGRLDIISAALPDGNVR